MPRKNKLPDSWMTIDVGLNTGVAIWGGSELEEYHLIQSRTKADEEQSVRIECLCNSLRKILEDTGPKMVIIEGVYLFGDSLKSTTAAKRGDLFFLAYMVGAYSNLCFNWTDKVLIRLAREWKGQLPDDVIARRVEKVYALDLPSTFKKSAQHVYDAIGIGMNTVGNLC